MKSHWEYFKYVIRHKRNVYREGRKLGLGRWRLLKHDLSKFSKAEWNPYRRRFFGPESERKSDKVLADFQYAWLHHLQRNPHHWQSWIIPGEPEVALLPSEEELREMVADWEAMGIEFGNTARDYYLQNKDRMVMHSVTRRITEVLLKVWEVE